MTFVYVIIGLMVLSLIWSLPTWLIALGLKRIIKKKVAKGWCIFIAVICFCVCCTIEILLFGVNRPGIFDTIIRFGCLSIVFSYLYDDFIPSIFDNEKEIKRKTEALKKTENTDIQ